MCFVLRQVQCGSRKDCLLVNIYPAIAGQRYGLGENEIDKVVLATRFKGDSLFPPNRWPLEVYVLRLLVDDNERQTFENEELSNMAWAEIYKSAEDIPS